MCTYVSSTFWCTYFPGMYLSFYSFNYLVPSNIYTIRTRMFFCKIILLLLPFFYCIVVLANIGYKLIVFLTYPLNKFLTHKDMLPSNVILKNYSIMRVYHASFFYLRCSEIFSHMPSFF